MIVGLAFALVGVLILARLYRRPGPAWLVVALMLWLTVLYVVVSRRLT